MAGEWEECSLGDLINVKHGFAFQGEFIRDEPRGDILLTPGNFAIGGGFKADKFKYYDGPVPDEFVLAEGDLLVTMTDLSKQSDTLGLPAFVPAPPNGRRYLHNQRLGKVEIKDARAIERRFLHYLMCSAEYRHEILASATGTTVRHTSPERIQRFRFKLPPLDEQRAIGDILGTLDDKINLNRRMSETLDRMARSLFRSWFVDFDPVRAKCEGRDSGLPHLFADLFPARLVDSELGEIPEGWKVRGLDETARFLNGLALQEYPPTSDETLPVIKIAQLRARHAMGADRAASNVPQEFVVEDGDVLFSWSGSLDVVLWAGGKGALNQHLFKVTSEGFPKWFFYSWIVEHLPAFRRIAAAKATTMGHIQRHHLTEAKVAVPPRDIIEAADKRIGPLFSSIPTLVVQSRTLGQLKDLLLPELVSGALRIDDVRRVGSGVR